MAMAVGRIQMIMLNLGVSPIGMIIQVINRNQETTGKLMGIIVQARGNTRAAR